LIDVTVQHIGKKYRIGPEASTEPLGRPRRPWWRRSEEFWAVRDVSFDVRRGEALGIIGANGAGKSTILKLLAGITTPTVGRIVVHGRLAALLEVGAGFHPELTGRENAYLNGSILGMRRREIAAKLPAIVDFAEVSRFLDVPLKYYSSGMYVRLGFSIAAHLDPDILLIDEVLAVGDLSFQRKCLQRIEELKRAGCTIIFISHDLGAVERLCDRAVLMRRGQTAGTGAPAEMIALYQQIIAEAAAEDFTASRERRAAEITYFEFRGSGRDGRTEFRTGEPLMVRMDWAASEDVSDVIFYVYFYTQDNVLCTQLTSEDGPRVDLRQGKGYVEFTCPELTLPPGIYHVDVGVRKREVARGYSLHWLNHCAVLHVLDGTAVRGTFYTPHTWRIVVDDAPTPLEP